MVCLGLKHWQQKKNKRGNVKSNKGMKQILTKSDSWSCKGLLLLLKNLLPQFICSNHTLYVVECNPRFGFYKRAFDFLDLDLSYVSGVVIKMVFYQSQLAAEELHRVSGKILWIFIHPKDFMIPCKTL